MEAEAGDLTVKDVKILLSTYKDVVAKHTRLSKAIRRRPFFNVEGHSASSSQDEGTGAPSHRGE